MSEYLKSLCPRCNAWGNDRSIPNKVTYYCPNCGSILDPYSLQYRDGDGCYECPYCTITESHFHIYVADFRSLGTR